MNRFPTSAARGCLYFHSALGFTTQTLAYMLDSLVRVSRRVDENHFASVPNAHLVRPHRCNPPRPTVLCTPDRLGPHDRTPNSTLRSSSVQSTVFPQGYNMWQATLPSPKLCPANRTHTDTSTSSGPTDLSSDARHKGCPLVLTPFASLQ